MFQKRFKSLRRINYLDLVLLGIALVVILALYLLIFKRGEFVTVRFKVTEVYSLYQNSNSSPINEFSNMFVVGDAQRDELGRATAEIIDVYSFRTNPNQTEIYLDVKVKAVRNQRTNTYTLSGKKILFGETFIFNFSNVYVKLVALENPLSEIKQTETITKVDAELIYSSPDYEDVIGVLPYVATSIEVGDKMLSSNGQVLAEVLAVEITPAQQIIKTSNGAYNVDHPILKRVRYQLRVKTLMGEHYSNIFNYTSLQVGSAFPLDTGSTIVWPTITKIYQE